MNFKWHGAPASNGLPVGWLIALLLTNISGPAQSVSPTLPSTLLPDEGRHLGQAIPDVGLHCAGRPEATLSEIWTRRPVLLTLVFSRCAGVCSPFLRSLKTAVAATGGAGTDYEIVVGSFDKRDGAAEMGRMADALGLGDTPGWTFSALAADDAERLVRAVGFWFRWDERLQQFDHPAMLIAVARGRTARVLVGGEVTPVRLREVVDQLRGRFVPSYPQPGRATFRCFDYRADGKLTLHWGAALLILPGFAAVALALWAFRGPHPSV